LSLKFPNVRPESGEIVEPDDLNQNLKQFTDEINGNLTHENLADFVIPEKHFSDDMFCEVFQSSFESSKSWDSEGSGFRCSKETTGYIRVDTNDKSMPFINFMADHDGYIIVDFSVSFVWQGTGILSEEDLRQRHTVSAHFPVFHYDYVYGGGATADFASKLPAGGWIGICGEQSIFGEHGILTTKSRSVIGDAHDQSGLFFATNFPQGRWVAEANDRFACKFRITSNGNEVCESGWQYNGVDRNSIFLSGVIPVRAGRNEIRSEVRAGMLENIIGISAGIRAKTKGPGTGSGDVARKGQFFPKSFYSARDVCTPLPRSYSKEVLNVGQSADDPKNKRDLDLTYNFGINCTVNAANLVIQYRKR
tara:strand:- start:1425 stop:2516 length:1092 start_codon:yes stop_codon:yes gene_type:complete